MKREALPVKVCKVYSSLLILTCAYKRPEVFTIFLSHLPQLPLLVVGEQSDPCYEVLQQLRPDAWFVEHPNKPIGRKFNAGLQAAKDLDFSNLFITGSDDVFTPGLWDYYERNKDSDYVGLLDFYFTDFFRTKYCPGFQHDRKGEPHGAGRMIKREVLEKNNWTLWDDEINQGLDASATKKLKGLNTHFFRCKDIGEVALDIKLSENIQSMTDYEGEWVGNDILDKVLKKEVVNW